MKLRFRHPPDSPRRLVLAPVEPARRLVLPRPSIPGPPVADDVIASLGHGLGSTPQVSHQPRLSPLFMMLRRARNDMIDASDPAEQIENADATDPTEPIERADPTEPIDSTEPREPMERSES